MDYDNPLLRMQPGHVLLDLSSEGTHVQLFHVMSCSVFVDIFFICPCSKYTRLPVMTPIWSEQTSMWIRGHKTIHLAESRPTSKSKNRASPQIDSVSTEFNYRKALKKIKIPKYNINIQILLHDSNCNKNRNITQLTQPAVLQSSTLSTYPEATN